jgi:hypothetical protein
MKWVVSLGIGILWIVVTGAGMYSLMVFDTTPGESSATPATWPTASPIAFHLGRIHLIMLAHPQCPCTRASLAELAEIMTRSNGKVVARVLLYKPSQIPPHWGDDDLATTAKAIPGVTVMDDIDGVEAARFGAVTSGHTVLYDGEGNLRFSGGITGARGQAGDNSGRQTILSALDHAIDDGARTPVFGCPLLANRGVSEGGDTLCEN